MAIEGDGASTVGIFWCMVNCFLGVVSRHFSSEASCVSGPGISSRQCYRYGAGGNYRERRVLSGVGGLYQGVDG